MYAAFVYKTHTRHAIHATKHSNDLLPDNMLPHATGTGCSLRVQKRIPYSTLTHNTAPTCSTLLATGVLQPQRNQHLTTAHPLPAHTAPQRVMQEEEGQLLVTAAAGGGSITYTHGHTRASSHGLCSLIAGVATPTAQPPLPPLFRPPPPHTQTPTHLPVSPCPSTCNKRAMRCHTGHINARSVTFLVGVQTQQLVSRKTQPSQSVSQYARSLSEQRLHTRSLMVH